jgi:hypothetical protein
MALKYAMNRLQYVEPEAYQRLKQAYSPGLKLDLEKNKAYWESFQNPVEEFSAAFYDIFLKANDQEEGIVSYSRVVELIMGEYRKNRLNFDSYKKEENGIIKVKNHRTTKLVAQKDKAGFINKKVEIAIE